MLVCPKCKETLIKEATCYRCGQHHVFDIARRGYVHLILGNHKASGDEKEMVKARTMFLSSGYYKPLCDALIKIIKSYEAKIIVDAGCGEGYYTNQLHKALPHSVMYGFDLSKYAVDKACKENTKHGNDIIYGVANVFHMPLSNACADLILSVFAPFHIEENKRILKKGGVFIKVGPASKHLYELKRELYDEVYDHNDDVAQYEGFTCIHEQFITYEIAIQDQEQIHALYHMTPYFWKSPKEGSDRLKNLVYLKTKIQFHIEVFKKTS